MYSFRQATITDLETILRQRRLMFTEMGDLERANLPIEVLVAWFEKNILEGNYIGLLAQQDQTTVAGAGLMFYHWLPDIDGTLRGYFCNIYVEPEHRGKRLAKQLIQQGLGIFKDYGITNVRLHASDMGRPLYEKLGFIDVPEMMWRDL